MSEEYTAMDALTKSIVDTAKPWQESNEQVANYASGLWQVFLCMRRAYYDRTDPIRDDRDWFLTAEHGNILHEFLVDLLKRNGYWRGDEVRGGNAKFNLSYRMDCIVDFGDGPRPAEFKSVKRYAPKLDEEGNLMSKGFYKTDWDKWAKALKAPLFEHEVQLQAYLHFHEPVPYTHGYLVYYNKNDDKIKTWKVKYRPEIGKLIEEKLTFLEDCIKNKILPVALTDPEEKEEACRWCAYKDRCKNDNAEENL